MRNKLGLGLLALLMAVQAAASVNVTVNGTTYAIPQTNEKGWGATVTSWMQGVSLYTLQPTGGTFTLTADTDFGATFGLKSAYYKTRSSNIAGAGAFRLANTDLIDWRNNANSGNLALGVDTSDRLTFNGNPIIPSTALTASRALVSDASGVVSVSSVTSTELGYASGVTSSLCGINQSCIVTNKTISGSSNTLSNIGYSSLTLTGGIVNADINASAAIVDTKLATISTALKVSNSATTATSSNTNSAIVARDGSGNFSAGTVTAALTGTASGNTTYTANNHGVVISGSGNTMTVLAPNASTSKVLTSGGSSADPTWQDPAAAPSSSYEISNVGLAVSVGSSAMTIRLKQSDGSTDCSSGAAACKIGMRSSTAANGVYNQRSATAALSLVITSGSTLGQASGVTHYLFVYAIDSDGAGAIKLGVSLTKFDEGTLQTTTQEDGAGGADSNKLIYSDAVYTSKPIRLIGRLKNSQATAGTWASVPTEISLSPWSTWDTVALAYNTATGTLSGSDTVVKYSTVEFDTHNAYSTSTGLFTAPIAGKYRVNAATYQNATYTASQGGSMIIYINGAAYKQTVTRVPASTTNVTNVINALVSLAAGDTVGVYANCSGSSPAYNATAILNYIDIIREGN